MSAKRFPQIRFESGSKKGDLLLYAVVEAPVELVSWSSGIREKVKRVFPGIQEGSDPAPNPSE